VEASIPRVVPPERLAAAVALLIVKSSLSHSEY
jgi:hypothetical protein